MDTQIINLKWISPPIRIRERLSVLAGRLWRLSAPMRPYLRRAGRRLDRHRRVVAVIGALALHLLVLMALLPQVHDALAGGGHGGQGQAGSGDMGYAADLVAAAKPAVDPTQIVTPSPDDALDIARPSVAQASSDLALTVSDPSSLPAIMAAAADGGAGDNGATTGTSGDLWAAIAPCWQRVATSGTLPVTLEITFTADGHLAKPPVIDREGAATPAGLQSEARAIAALAQCGAYPMAANEASVKVNFPKPD